MLVEELHAASSLLDNALKRYAEACDALENCTVTRLLFDRLSSELGTVTSFEKRIHQAKLSLSRARNNPSPLVMINSLPPEVLTRIFQLVISARACMGDEANPDPKFPVYPELLSHVCSRWRRILIGCRSIWAHIDLILFRPFSQRLLIRAKAFVSRAAPLALTLHIVDPLIRDENPFDISHCIQFLASVAPRTRSLELTTCSDDEAVDFHCLVLQTFLAGAVVGTLGRVSIHVADVEDEGIHRFIRSAEDLHGRLDLLLDVPHQRLEDAWHSITTLHLNAFYPPWTSKAYHGLVELCLTAVQPVSTLAWLTESQFMNILSSSPGLRILQFDLELIDRRSSHESVVPVRLDDLETLDLVSPDFDHVAGFLRLIAPGPKPHQMIVKLKNDSGSPSSFFVDEARKFFARSNVASFSMEVSRGYQYRWADIVLGLLPSLESLALDSFVCDERCALSCAPNNQTTPAEPRHFDHLHLAFSRIDLKALQQIIQNHMVHTLRLWSCSISLNGMRVSDEEVRNYLSETGVVVNCKSLYQF